MTTVPNEGNLRKRIDINRPVSKAWNVVCTISHVVFSVLYAPVALYFTVLGLIVFSLGLPSEWFPAACYLIAESLFLLTPAFCVASIVFSVRLRKKDSYKASIWVQLLPFGILAIAVCCFCFPTLIL